MPKKLSQNNIIIRAKSIHNNRYDYSNVIFKTLHEKVEIICPIHGIFKQALASHIFQKRGCPVCGMSQRIQHNVSQRLTTKEFIQKANQVHNDKYVYTDTHYINARSSVIVNCKKHGYFTVRPTDHIHRKTGCPKCANISRSENNPGGAGYYSLPLFNSNVNLANTPAILYLVKLSNKDKSFIKIGITKRSTEKRMKDIHNFEHKLLFEFHASLKTCFIIEQQILEKFKNEKLNIIDEFDGNTELFNISAENYIQEYLTQII